MRDNIYTTDIYDIEKQIGNQHSRKEKLDALELGRISEIIEESYRDWLVSKNEIGARMIARIMYSYRRDEEEYNLWMDKFGDIELVMDELKKL